MRELDIRSLRENAFTLFDKRWTLITAGTRESRNTMTASWGGLGTLWNKPVVSVYLRPQRYTCEFIDRTGCFTLTFFGEGERRDALNLCGTKSGREVDKFATAGLTPAWAKCGAPYVAEGSLVLVCRELFAQEFRPESFLDAQVREKNYPEKDYHRMYVGEIVEAYSRD